MGKKHDKDKSGSRKINVEIAPGIQQVLDRYIDGYNGKPDRKTPKIKKTDVVNEALDAFLNAHPPAPQGQKQGQEKEVRKKHGEKHEEGK